MNFLCFVYSFALVCFSNFPPQRVLLDTDDKSFSEHILQQREDSFSLADVFDWCFGQTFLICGAFVGSSQPSISRGFFRAFQNAHSMVGFPVGGMVAVVGQRRLELVGQRLAWRRRRVPAHRQGAGPGSSGERARAREMPRSKAMAKAEARHRAGTLARARGRVRTATGRGQQPRRQGALARARGIFQAGRAKAKARHPVRAQTKAAARKAAVCPR